MRIIVDLGAVLLLLAILLIGGIFAGTAILEKVILFLFGPFKIGGIILVILSVLGNALSGFKEQSNSSFPSRIIGAILNIMGGVLRCIISVIFLLCVMLGFLQNMEIGGLHILWAAFAILSDGLVFLLLFSGSLCVDGLVTMLTERIPMFLVGIVNIVLSVIYFMIAQGLLIGFYEETVIELFSNHAWICDFVLNSWFSKLMGL